MFNVYEVCTWDDVTYTEVSSYDKEIDAKKECDRLNVEHRSKKYNPSKRYTRRDGKANESRT